MFLTQTDLTECHSLDRPGEHGAKRNEPDGERQMLQDSTYVWNLKNQPASQTNKPETAMDTENRRMVARGEGEGLKTRFGREIMR